jgi:hypothetical protein
MAASRNESGLLGLPKITDGGTSMAVDGHGHAMTIADYIAFCVLFVLALSAAVEFVRRNNMGPK